MSNKAHDQIALRRIEEAARLGTTHLDLGGHRLTDLPIQIGQLSKLTSLDLSGNKLNSLPEVIFQLSELTSLDLFANKLTALPAEIAKLTNLTSLDLGNNQLVTLPPEIRTLENLNRLDLHGNQLPIPPEILEKINDPQFVLSYYFEYGNKPLNEIKLLFVGEGSVGKTSLIQRLLFDTYNPGQAKTQGIIINRWQVGGSDGQETNSTIRINIWDFGGQEIMHATHQFYLTKRSLYILVLDARLTQEENRVEYWLKIIQSFGGDSPVIIVGNKTDQHPLDINRMGLGKKYPNIVNILETSALTGIGISELSLTIAKQVHLIPHVHDLLPETWFTVKSRLETLGQEKNYLTYNEYVSLCNRHNVGNEARQRSLIGFLHDLGVVLYFQDDRRLADLGILNPEWGTKGVYRILNWRPLFDNEGILTLPMLDEILNMPEYPKNKRLFIVDLMRKFELCYDIEPNQTFLIPDLLPKNEPYTGEWKDALTFQYHYDFLPSSIISRFIVRMSAFIHQTVWRSGVVLKHKGNIALVKADSEERKFFIWVSGDENTRRDFLSVIRAEIASIHNTIARIEALEKVPVPNQSHIVVDYDHLLMLEQKGITEYIPEGMQEPINVKKLLNGVVPENERRPLDDLRLPVNNSFFVKFPLIIGRIGLEIIGRERASVTTVRHFGWALTIGIILLIILLIISILSPEVLINVLNSLIGKGR